MSKSTRSISNLTKVGIVKQCTRSTHFDSNLKHLVLGVIRACKQGNNDYVLTLKVYQPLCL